MQDTALKQNDQSTEVKTEIDDLPFRVAPHNIQAEQELLGAILINNESADRVSGFLSEEHFFDPLHARIYETACRLIQSGK